MSKVKKMIKGVYIIGPVVVEPRLYLDRDDDAAASVDALDRIHRNSQHGGGDRVALRLCARMGSQP